MGVLQRFERKLEGAVGGAFARVFKGRVHPAEIGRALQREADEQKSVVGEGRVLVPNRYVVVLAEADHEHLGDWEHQLTTTLAQLLHEQIDNEGWSTFGYVVVTFEVDKNLRTGIFDVRSRVDPNAPGQRKPAFTGPRPAVPRAAAAPPARPAPAAPPSYNGTASPPAYDAPPPAYAAPSYAPPPASAGPQAVHCLVIDGPNTRYPLQQGSNLVGRGQDAQVKLPDTGVSRRHVDITVDGDVAVAHDLGSTNGSIVNGQRIAAQQLRDGDVIRIGHSVLVYRVDQG